MCSRRGGVGSGVGGGNVDAAVLDLFVLEQLFDLFWGQAIDAVSAVVSLSPVDGRRVAVGAWGRRETFGQTTRASCMSTNGIVGMGGAIVVGMSALGEDCAGLKPKEQDQIQADQHQLERRLKRDHDAETMATCYWRNVDGGEM